jgi:Leucine-rich repeat (LRR) protein
VKRPPLARVRNSIGLGLEKNPDVEEMKKILSLSYNDLTIQLKTCLLYLSMYPEDYEIQMEDVVRRWIAERFVKVDCWENLFDTGKHYFNELINRSLIQPTDIDYNGQAMACRVHDMIRDLIISKAVEENFITPSSQETLTLVSQNKIRRLSIDYGGQENVKTKSSMVTAHVRSLSVFGYTDQVPPLLEFPALRMLALDRSEKLEISYLHNIGKLFLLRYLRIEGSYITELPEQIGDLHCLEMLDLYGTTVRELPKSIVKLGQLKLLLVDGVKLPHGVGNMQGLEELSCVTVDDSTSINLLQELGCLTRLRTLGLKLCIRVCLVDWLTSEILTSYNIFLHFAVW